jgi:hypothetical protein
MLPDTAPPLSAAVMAVGTPPLLYWLTYAVTDPKVPPDTAIETACAELPMLITWIDEERRGGRNDSTGP